MKLERRPAKTEDDFATYPTLDGHGDSRRRFLKLCALTSAAATLGFQLTGCPSTGSGGTGGGTGTVAGGGTGGGTDWIPWEQHEPQIDGDVAMPLGKPVGLVVAGAPIAATFKDGVKVEIVVAAIITPYQGLNAQAEFVKLAGQHTQIVVDTAKQHPSTVLTNSAALDTFEAMLLSKLSGTLGSGYIDEVSVAKKAEGKPAKADVAPARDEEKSDSDAAMDMAPMDDRAPAPDPMKRTPKAGRFWTTCRKRGCKTCG